MSAQPEEPTPAETEIPVEEPDVIPAEPGEPEPESEPEPGPEPEPEPTEPTQLSEKEIEKRVKALERESERHTKRVQEILEEEALSLVVCEACEPAVQGFHYAASDYPADSPQRALYELLSGGQGEQMRHPSYFQTCETCNGFGQVLTGARTEITRTVPCQDCAQSGYIDTRKPVAAVAPLPVASPAAVEAAAPTADDTPRDFNGRPAGHERFGVLNNFLTRSQWEADRTAGFDVGETFIGIPG